VKIVEGIKNFQKMYKIRKETKKLQKETFSKNYRKV